MGKPVKAVVCDFDGTFSTLRCGWEAMMKRMMMRYLPDEAWIDEFISVTTGVQTILQMKDFVAELKRRGAPAPTDDPWFYKNEYNAMLMETVALRRDRAASGAEPAETWLVPGTRLFLQALKTRGVKVFIASGTDQDDVRAEAEALGLAVFADGIEGALPKSESCAKETVLKRLVGQAGVGPDELAVIGDGKVEMALGRALGARTLGLATNETDFSAPSEMKRARLEAAGAERIVGDFRDLRPILDFFGLDANPSLPFDAIRTYDARDRVNLVTISSMLRPGVDPVPDWTADGFDELVARVRAARRNGRPVVFSMGAHVIKNNMSLYLIDLMERGVITHVAGNGACSIHDFELAYLGGTSEDVPTAIEDGSFGMWEQTGRWMNEAIQQGVAAGYGYGESLARYIDAHRERFPFREQCVLYKAWTFGIPATYHIALGTDIIHQHPIVDFGAIGVASGRDFHAMCNAVSQLDRGVYLNFGSAVVGPEVFLKALSISRNLGYPTFDITTANFDLKPLGDYRCKIGYDDPNYYYRPRKNIVNRPVSRGGRGWHFVGDHKATIANLWKGVTQ